MVRTESAKRSSIKTKSSSSKLKRKQNGVSRVQPIFASRTPVKPRQPFSIGHWLSHARYMVWTVLLVFVIPLYFFYNILGKNATARKDSEKTAVVSSSPTIPALPDSVQSIGTFTFTGGKDQKSTIHGNTIDLFVEPNAEWSGVDIEFSQPIDLFSKQLVFFAHSVNSKVNLKIAATDIDRKTSHSSEWYTVPLSSERKKITFASEQVKGFLDKHKISRIRLLIQNPQGNENTIVDPAHATIEMMTAWLK